MVEDMRVARMPIHECLRGRKEMMSPSPELVKPSRSCNRGGSTGILARDHLCRFLISRGGSQRFRKLRPQFARCASDDSGRVSTIVGSDRWRGLPSPPTEERCNHSDFAERTIVVPREPTAAKQCLQKKWIGRASSREGDLLTSGDASLDDECASGHGIGLTKLSRGKRVTRQSWWEEVP